MWLYLFLCNDLAKNASPKVSKKALVKRIQKSSVVKYSSGMIKDDSSQSLCSEKDPRLNNFRSKPGNDSGSQSETFSSSIRLKKSPVNSSDDQSDDGVRQSWEDDVSKKFDGSSAGEFEDNKTQQLIRRKVHKNLIPRAAFQSPSYKICNEYGLIRSTHDNDFVADNINEGYIKMMEQNSKKRIWTQVDTDASSDENIDHDPNRKLPNL